MASNILQAIERSRRLVSESRELINKSVERPEPQKFTFTERRALVLDAIGSSQASESPEQETEATRVIGTDSICVKGDSEVTQLREKVQKLKTRIKGYQADQGKLYQELEEKNKEESNNLRRKLKLKEKEVKKLRKMMADKENIYKGADEKMKSQQIAKLLFQAKTQLNSLQKDYQEYLNSLKKQLQSQKQFQHYVYQKACQIRDSNYNQGQIVAFFRQIEEKFSAFREKSVSRSQSPNLQIQHVLQENTKRIMQLEKKLVEQDERYLSLSRSIMKSPNTSRITYDDSNSSWGSRMNRTSRRNASGYDL